MKNNKPKVSVVCMTFNHAKFIRQALDGFVMQKTNFPFEVVIHDDASTDGTADIIREYAKKYPDIIKPILQTQNQWSLGTNISTQFIWPEIRGKYVTVCDGDDYWTDPYKLQKQADFLDRHPDYAICFHPVACFYEDNTPEHIWPSKREVRDVSLDKLLIQNFIPNCAVMYRWRTPGAEWPSAIYPGDWFVHLLHARHGKIKCIPDVMARYRRHSGGISFASEQGANALYRQWGLYQMNFFTAVEKQIAPDPAKYHMQVRKWAREIMNAYAENQEFDKALQVLKMCPDALNIDTDTVSKKWRRRFNRLMIFTGGMCAITMLGAALLII